MRPEDGPDPPLDGSARESQSKMGYSVGGCTTFAAKSKISRCIPSENIATSSGTVLSFVKDAKQLAYAYALARNRYKDTPVLGKDVGAKVRKLIDDHAILNCSPF